MVYSLNYRRPPYAGRSSTQSSLSVEDKQRSINRSIASGSSGLSHGIPEALSFDRIVGGGTCPPLTLRDFLNYLKYIEYTTENLQFYMWHRDYTKRFYALPENESMLSPAWVGSPVAETDTSAAQNQGRKLMLSPETAVVLQGTGLESTTEVGENEKSNPFRTPPRSLSQESRHNATASEYSVEEHSNAAKSSYADSARKRAESAFEDAGAKWQPFTIQPFRDEIARVISIYIADGGARQLNLSARERTALLNALESTTHPSSFHKVLVTVEWSLRCQSHPNFIRWAICNGNRPRVMFARGLGVFGIVGGIITALLITLSGVGRAWRVFAFILFFIGISTLIAAWKGMCVVLHGMHHRHLRPWELFQDEDDATVELKNQSSDSFLTSSSNSYEDEPWIAKYEKRNLIRKVFDKEQWIEEPALRQIQDTIFLQSLLGACVGSAILTGIFVGVPAGHLY